MVEVAGSLGEQLGAALRTERFLRSTSQRALALELGVSKSFIGRLESGDLRGSAAAIAALVQRLGLAFAIVVPDEDLGGAMVDDSPEARDLAERWRRSNPARRDDVGRDSSDAREQLDEPSAAPATRTSHTPHPTPPGGTTRGPTRGAAGERHVDDGGLKSGESGSAGGRGSVGEGGPAFRPQEMIGEDDVVGGHGGPAGDEEPIGGDEGGHPDQRPSWMVSSRNALEELTVPGQPPPERAGRRVVVGVPAAQRSLRLDRFYDDPVAQVVAASWLRRAEAERVRDAAGRRMPAHVVCFPIQLPRTWWACRHIAWDWRKRPIWSWRRRPLWVVEALMTGPNPPPVGAHPFGGYPLQGHPSQDVRGDWPPDPSLRASPRRQ